MRNAVAISDSEVVVNPLSGDEISDIIDGIRGGMPQGTRWEVNDDVTGATKAKDIGARI